MEEDNKPARPSKLRTLVYVGLAGGMVGVSSMSLAAHGNSTPCAIAGQKLSWVADDFVIVDRATERVVAPTE